MRVKKGDIVIVLSGKDRGKKGKVLRALPGAHRVVVEGINVMKRRKRPTRANQKGETLSIAMPLHASNVALIDPKSGKQTRTGVKVVGGKRVRVAKKSGAEI